MVPRFDTIDPTFEKNKLINCFLQYHFQYTQNSDKPRRKTTTSGAMDLTKKLSKKLTVTAKVMPKLLKHSKMRKC